VWWIVLPWCLRLAQQEHKSASLAGKKYIPLSSLHGLFGEGHGRSRFKYTDCKDANMRRFLEDIWPICYDKVGMPPSKLIAKEFCLGILAQFQQNMDVDWTVFAAKTNAS
jgi:hypothetical protein